MNIFETASRLKLRFPTPVGQISSEDLWTLPLSSTVVNKPNLNDIAKELYAQLKATEETVDFVGTAPKKTDDSRLRLETAFEVVKHVIASVKAAAELKANEAAKAQARQRLLELKAKRAEEKLDTLSDAEIDAQLAALA